MKVSLFIKSHERDFPWLEYCRKSINRFAKGFHEVVLALPEGSDFNWPEAKIVKVREQRPFYLAQQTFKLYADTFCEGEFITYMDSDTIFIKEIHPDDLFRDGKPIWLLRPYENARTDQQVWRVPTSKFLKDDFEFEGMARHPMTCPVNILKRMRGFCQYVHGIPLNEYVMTQGNPEKEAELVFSEFNAIAAFSYHHCHGYFHWINMKDQPAPDPVCHQGFTWAGRERMEQDIEQFKKILGEDQQITEVVTEPVEITGPSETILSLESALSILSCEARKSPLHKARLMKRITAALAGEKKPQAPKRRRKGEKKSGVEKRLTVKAQQQAIMDAPLTIHPKGWAATVA